MIRLAIFLLLMTAGCAKRPSQLQAESKDAYWHASHTAGIPGKYRSGRGTLGSTLNLDSQGSFEMTYIWDICPFHTIMGEYYSSHDSIFIHALRDSIEETADTLCMGMIEPFKSYWDTLYYLELNGAYLLCYRKADSADLQLYRIALESNSEYHKEDWLPFRKMK